MLNARGSHSPLSTSRSPSTAPKSTTPLPALNEPSSDYSVSLSTSAPLDSTARTTQPRQRSPLHHPPAESIYAPSEPVNRLKAGPSVALATGSLARLAPAQSNKRPASSDPHALESPAKRQSKWSADENALIVQLRGSSMKWDEISKRLPGRSSISCRLHYQNFLERRPEWDEEKKNKLAVLYERFKKEMWDKVSQELQMPWRAAEAMHWQLGSDEIAQRAGVPKFVTAHITSSAGVSTPRALASDMPPVSEHPIDPSAYVDPQSRHPPPGRIGQPYTAVTTPFQTTQPRPAHLFDPSQPRSQKPYISQHDSSEDFQHLPHPSRHRSPLSVQDAQPHRSRRSTSTVAALAHHTSRIHSGPRRRSDSANRADYMPPLLNRPQLFPLEGGERLPPMKLLTEPDGVDYTASGVHYRQGLQPRDMEAGNHFRVGLGGVYEERYSPPLGPPDGGSGDGRPWPGEKGAGEDGGGRR